ncbi:hypothetical protein [uncultured Psychroserpens sp.]|uniref:hypothetical protein n=1 Tax=uncultured Psychroserpens sp. TaxID=255436 RepID=UPI002606D35A|nr:hypothetical protein [uncultured Psychroserpens sp.]
MEDLKQQFEDELEKAKQSSVLSANYRRRKFIMYLVRTMIAVVLIYIFWEQKWVKWALIVYIPLNLFVLFSIFGMPYFLNKKINSTRQKIEELDQLEDDWEEE